LHVFCFLRDNVISSLNKRLDYHMQCHSNNIHNIRSIDSNHTLSHNTGITTQWVKINTSWLHKCTEVDMRCQSNMVTKFLRKYHFFIMKKNIDWCSRYKWKRRDFVTYISSSLWISCKISWLLCIIENSNIRTYVSLFFVNS
jgi:hypothetical protein